MWKKRVDSGLLGPASLALWVGVDPGFLLEQLSPFNQAR